MSNTDFTGSRHAAAAMNAWLARLLALCSLMSLAACASFLPDQYTFSQAEIERSLAKRFPVDRRVLELFDVRLSNPKVTLDAQRNRISTRFDAQIKPPLLGKTLNGSLALTSGLRYDAPSRTVRLHDPQVDRFELADRSSGAFTALPLSERQINAIGSWLTEQLLQDAVIHTFKPEDLKVAGQTLEPATITVLPGGISVDIRPR